MNLRPNALLRVVKVEGHVGTLARLRYLEGTRLEPGRLDDLRGVVLKADNTLPRPRVRVYYSDGAVQELVVPHADAQ